MAWRYDRVISHLELSRVSRVIIIIFGSGHCQTGTASRDHKMVYLKETETLTYKPSLEDIFNNFFNNNLFLLPALRYINLRTSRDCLLLFWLFGCGVGVCMYQILASFSSL